MGSLLAKRSIPYRYSVGVSGFNSAAPVVFLKCRKFTVTFCATLGAQCHTDRAKVTADMHVVQLER